MLNSLLKQKLDERQARLQIRSMIGSCKKKMHNRLDALRYEIDNGSTKLPAEVKSSFAYLDQMGEAITALHQTLDPKQKVHSTKKQSRHIKMSSVTLRRIVLNLTSDPESRERMLFITGIEDATDGTVTLTDPLNVRMSDQSVGYVKAHAGHSAALIETLSNDGHQLWGMFHNHPTTGQASTKPSQTDLENQQRLSDFRMSHVLGGIASMDGFFRLFSTVEDFQLTMFGSGAELIEDNPREKVLKVNLEDKTNALLVQ